MAPRAHHVVDRHVGPRQTAVAHAGPVAPAASILMTIINTFLPFPTDLMIVANGAVFGFWNGLLVSIVGAMASACLAFGLARRVGQKAARRLVPAHAGMGG